MRGRHASCSRAASAAHAGIGESKEVKEALEKKEEEPGKEECQSCYGAGDTPEMCCNTCAEVRAQYRKKGWSFDSFGMQIKQVRLLVYYI